MPKDIVPFLQESDAETPHMKGTSNPLGAGRSGSGYLKKSIAFRPFNARQNQARVLRFFGAPVPSAST